MGDTDEYIKKGLDLVDQYLDVGNLASALNGCEELMRLDPYHKGARNMYSKVRTLIIKDNERRVDQDISSTMHLWKEEKFDQLYAIYRKLLAFAPEHKRLRELMKKLGIKIQDVESKQRSELLEKATNAIEDLLHEKKFLDAVSACNEILELAPLNSKAKGLLKRSKKLLIEDELEKNQRIVEGSDFERAIEFYRGLLAIDPENGTITSLQKRAMEHLKDQEKVSVRISINESEVRLKDLFKNAEYEKVLQACDEIIRQDSKNLTAKIYHTKAEHQLEIESAHIVLKKMQSKEYRDTMRAERAQSPETFVYV